MIRRIVPVLAVAIALLLTTLDATADTAQTWTTTADFDSGTSEQGTDYGMGIGYDQPIFGYISKPSAIYVAAVDRTYVAFQGRTTHFIAYMTYFDHATNAWTTPVALGGVYSAGEDGHGAPSFWVDSDGFILAMWGSHSSNQNVSRSSSPYSISSWDQLTSPCTPPSCSSTYPSLFEYGGSIYYYHRNGDAQGGAWMFNTTTNTGDTWASGITFLQFAGLDGAYFGGHKQDGSSLWYSFVKYQISDDTRRNAYVCRWDLTNNSQYGSNGVFLGPVVDLTEADANCLVSSSGSEWTGWVSIDLDSQGRPMALWAQGNTSLNIDHRFSRWNGSAWSSPVQFQETDSLSNYGTLLYHSDTDIDAFLTAGGFRELDSCCDDFGGDLEHWFYNGTLWNIMDEPILTESLSGIPVNRPFVPLNHVPELEIVFDAWAPSAFATKFGFGTTRVQVIGRVYGWGESGLLMNGAVSSVLPGVQTNTDNPTVSAGEFVLANERQDPFLYSGPAEHHQFWQEMRTGDGIGQLYSNFTGSNLFVYAEHQGGTGRIGNTFVSKFGVEGDADVRIKFEETDAGTGTVLYAICMWNQSDSCDSVGLGLNWYGDQSTFGTTGVLYRHIFGTPQPIEAFSQVNGNDTVLEDSTSVTCSPTCYMRITRFNGITFNTSYSTNGISYTQTDSITISALDGVEPMYVALSASCNGCSSGNWTVSMDDWNMAAGNIRYGWRPTGAWQSPLQVYAGDNFVPSSVEVTISGAVAGSRYVDSVAIVSATDEVLWEDETNRIASFNASIPYTVIFESLRQDWKVQVRLAGDGFGSVSVLDITVSETFYFTTAERIVLYGWQPVLFFFFLGLVLFIAILIKRRREER